jgi:prephenate dehydrogenase
MHFKRISILGVGLLGGSIGMAAKSLGTDVQITGYGHRRHSLDKAIEIGAIDRAELNLKPAVADADLVILCTPVGTFPTLMKDLAGLLPAGAVVTDVGSTKRSVVELGERFLPGNVHFVGSHPMAGSEKRGVEFARTDLFQNALCLLTPTPRSNPDALESVDRFWQSLGMTITRLAPDEHDRLLADISHLPHALAAALIAMQEDAALQIAGKGFLDTTRIASGDGALWRDILLDNRDNLRRSIQRLQENLGTLEKLLEAKDGEKLAQWLDASAHRRGEVLAHKLREMLPD